MAGWKDRHNLDSKEWRYDYWFIFYIYIGFNLGELQKAISKDTGININSLDKSDILEITLTPVKFHGKRRKISISYRLCIEY